jgi:hypothetical protein
VPTILSKRLPVLALLVIVAVAAASSQRPAAARSQAACLGAGVTNWIDYGDKWVPFRRMFFRPGFAVAAAHVAPAVSARRRGAAVAYWTMALENIVGTPRAPAGPGRVRARGARLAAAAVRVTGCANPVIALNELYGSQVRAPWSRGYAQYRANVLALLRDLSARGAQPHLLISQGAATGGAAGDWWRSVAAVASIVRELYVPAPLLSRMGPSVSTVYMRFQLRRAIRNFTTIGIPSSRVGIVLGFQSGIGGRDGLGAGRWYGVVKRNVLITRQIASEMSLGSVWSWGWARFRGRRADPAAPIAACVYLWARDPSLCNGPGAVGAGFNQSRDLIAERPADARMRVLSARHPTWVEVSAAAKLSARVAWVQEQVGGQWRSLDRVVLAPFHPLHMRVPLANGQRVLRLYVAPENAPAGGGFATAPVTVRVH